jgi:ABC-type glycerol-3-phosphate transport system permease component
MARSPAYADFAPHGRRWTKRFGRRLLRLCFLWTLNLFFLFFFLFPFFLLVTTAVKPPREADAIPLQWFPTSLYWGNFRVLFGYFDFQRYVFNSTLVALITTLIALTLSAAAAYALARLPLPAKRTLLVLTVAAISISAITMVPSLYLLLREFGWLNTRRALLAPYVAISLPFATWILTNAFRQIPVELTEQGEVDGCTPLATLWRVVLPLASPSLITAGVVIFLTAWNEYEFAAIFILDAQSPIETAPVVLAGIGGSWGIASAASLIVALPMVAVVLILQQQIVQGLTAGALKG